MADTADALVDRIWQRIAPELPQPLDPLSAAVRLSMEPVLVALVQAVAAELAELKQGDRAAAAAR